MVKKSYNPNDSQLQVSDDSNPDLPGNEIFESPWNLWKDLKTSDYFFRRNLSKTLYYAIQIRLFRDYIKQEFAKNRSRRGAAVKRAYAYSKNDAKKIIDTLEALDLHQLWNALDTRSTFDSKSLNERLEGILSRNIGTILKKNVNDTNKYDTTGKDPQESESEIDSDVPKVFSVDGLEESQTGLDGTVDNEEEDINNKNGNKNNIEDKFFKLDEMEAFANEQLESGDDIDYFDSLGEESDDSIAAADMKYSDFFRDPEGSDEELVEDYKPLDCKRDLADLDEYDKQMELMLQQLEDQEEEEEDDEDIYRNELDLLDGPDDQSDNELDGQAEEKDHITQIESELATPKHWSLMGEATGKSRPRNSLLDIDIELPQTNSVVYNDQLNSGMMDNKDTNGLINSQMNQTLNYHEELPIELIIIQRIKSGIFDNVERKVFIEDQLESLNRLNKNKNEELNPEDIDFNKSEMGLGEVYAQKYKEQFMALDKLDPHKKELNEQFARLIYKLDSLSNATFVPKRTSESEKATAVPIISVETPVNIVVSGSDHLGTNKNVLLNSTSQKEQGSTPSGLFDSPNKAPSMSTKTTRSAKKRKFKNKMKGLIKSGKLSLDQVEKIKEKMINRNKIRRDDAKSKKKTGLTSREQVRHDMKSNRRIDTNKLLSNISN